MDGVVLQMRGLPGGEASAPDPNGGMDAGAFAARQKTHRSDLPHIEKWAQ